MKDLSKHCSDLSHLVSTEFRRGTFRIRDPYAGDLVAEWLWLAAGLVRVEVDSIRHLSSFGYCSASDEYSLKSEEVHQQYALAVSRFNFVWNSFEGLATQLVSRSQADKVGKVNAVCDLLSVHLDSEVAFPHYHAAVQSLLDLTHGSARFRSQIKFDAGLTGYSGLGIKVVYGIRNSFAHGSMPVPEPTGDGPEIGETDLFDSQVVDLSTRVVLLSQQMMLASHLVQQGQDSDMSYWWCPYDLQDWIGSDRTVKAQQLLRKLHCDYGVWESQSQTSLFPDLPEAPASALRFNLHCWQHAA